jgi:hypothetical protein
MSDQAHVPDGVVSYGGNKWIVNRWNCDQVPGGAVGAGNNDDSC